MSDGIVLSNKFQRKEAKIERREEICRDSARRALCEKMPIVKCTHVPVVIIITRVGDFSAARPVAIPLLYPV